MFTRLTAPRSALLILFLLALACGTAAERQRAALTALASATPTPADLEAALAFEAKEHLDVDELVEAVLLVNPTLDAARQAWRAALAEVTQATALEDPWVSYSIAPLSIGSDNVPFGQSARLAQSFPLPGKLDARGRVARSEADAARASFEAARLDLALLTRLLFLDRWETERALALNAHHIVFVEELKVTAEAALETGRASLEDPLQAELLLAGLERTRLALEARARTVDARLNGLLHRAPDAALPKPPASLEVLRAPEAELPELFARALAQRPELAAVIARREGAEARVDLAWSRYLPDFMVEAQYTSMFMQLEHQLMIGGGLKIPLSLDAKGAGVDEAEARVRWAERERAKLEDDVRVEVQAALISLDEAARAVALYRGRLVPAAKARVPAARAAFEAGRDRFSSVVEAENALSEIELSLERAIAEQHRALVRLRRALGEIGRTPNTDDGGA